jgi:hypothetical protein
VALGALDSVETVVEVDVGFEATSHGELFVAAWNGAAVGFFTQVDADVIEELLRRLNDGAATLPFLFLVLAHP